MQGPFDALAGWQELLERGGPVLLAILLLSTLMWTLICERYWYFLWVYPSERGRLISAWRRRGDRSSPQARRLRQSLIDGVSASLRARLSTIRTLIVVLPLLGLLGTVAGLITTFEVLNVYGTGNVRGFAGGIYEALITTAGGLITSLSGVYFSLNLEQRAAVQTLSTANGLR